MTEPLLTATNDTELIIPPGSNTESVDEYALSQIHSIFPQCERQKIENMLLQNKNDITICLNILMDEEQRNTEYMLAKTLENQ